MLVKADARLLPIRSDSVHCVVTSPPYWGLRDYGSEAQIGLEKTPEAYVESLVAVFREVWRVLKSDGTVWLNLGDSYNAYNGGAGPSSSISRGASTTQRPRLESGFGIRCSSLKPKDLVGIPWRVAFALQADGWYLRQDIIWHKPNPMPESVTDRCTKAHEYLFLLAKSERYFYDAEAISERAIHDGKVVSLGEKSLSKGQANGQKIKPSGNGQADAVVVKSTRNKRSVWTINSQPVSDAHFATMPEALVEPCILAGCPLGGLVLDPFIGSGTVGRVAERFGRRWIGTDLSYQAISRKRTAQRGLLQLAVDSAV